MNYITYICVYFIVRYKVFTASNINRIMHLVMYVHVFLGFTNGLIIDIPKIGWCIISFNWNACLLNVWYTFGSKLILIHQFSYVVMFSELNIFNRFKAISCHSHSCLVIAFHKIIHGIGDHVQQSTYFNAHMRFEIF